jgi:hypothetical protein
VIAIFSPDLTSVTIDKVVDVGLLGCKAMYVQVHTNVSVQKMETVCFSETLVPVHGFTTQKNNIDILTAVRTSNLTKIKSFLSLSAKP